MLGWIHGSAARAASHLGAPAEHALVAWRPRTVTTLTSLEGLPERVLRVPIFPAGRQGLARLGVPGHTLLASPGGFRDGVAQLNRMIGPDPRCVARCGLTRDETLGAALGVLQAAHRVARSSETPEVRSVVHHLLSSLPVDRQMRDALERHAQRIAQEVSLEWMARSDASRWWSQAPSDRERALVQLAHAMPVLASEARMAAGVHSRMDLGFDQMDPLAARFTPYQDPGAGLVSLSDTLIASEPPSPADLALLMVPALLAHEILHLEQYGAMRLLESSVPQSYEHHAAATCYGLSIGAQESVWRQDCSTALSPFLPHEQEAWLLASLVLRATIRHPGVPGQTADCLKARLVDTYPRYAAVQGERFAPWARAADGVLWDRGGADLALRDMSRDEMRQRVQDFVENPLPSQD